MAGKGKRTSSMGEKRVEGTKKKSSEITTRETRRSLVRS
jgi:hypothetical protein